MRRALFSACEAMELDREHPGAPVGDAEAGSPMMNADDLLTETMEVYVQPGELYFTTKPAVIRTVLGSCVGVTFWSPKLGAGAMLHAQLPVCPKVANGVSSATGHHYVDYSIRDAVRRFDALGANRKELEIKLFGGADVLPVGGAALARRTVGRLNCITAIEMLRAEGLEITTSSIRGTSGINLRFDTRTGTVYLKSLN